MQAWFGHRLAWSHSSVVPGYPSSAQWDCTWLVVERIIQELDRFADPVGKLHYAVQKLGTYAAAFRAVVHFNLDPCGGDLRPWRIRNVIGESREGHALYIQGASYTLSAPIEQVGVDLGGAHILMAQ
jgi:hypothetical protein